MPIVQSTALEEIAYNEKARTLQARFRETGRTFLYRGVPQELYDALLFADSLGAFFKTHIQDRFSSEEI
jgi:hypothetical protein